MSEIQQLVGRMPVGHIAQQAGVSEAEARQAIDAIVPVLVAGMQANAADPAGAQSLAGALGAHRGHLNERLGGAIDTDDGARIVQNVFGGGSDEIARAAGGGSALGGIIQKILPIVAPIVIAWIANRFFGQGTGQATEQQETPAGGGFDSPFGNEPAARHEAPAAQQEQQQGGGLGDLLGGILGGGSSSGASSGPLGPLGDILGGLLGNGRR